MTMETGRKVSGYTAVCQLWLESERGWGSRPDGYSLHLSEADLAEYVRKYWHSMPDVAPEEYSKPYGRPFLVLLTEEDYAEVISKGHVRSYSTAGTPAEYRP